MPVTELDVRAMPKAEKHPRIFEWFTRLARGESFVLVNNHDPRHLRREFETDYAGAFDWHYVESGPATWRIRITKLASTALPQILCDAHAVAAALDTDATGAVWKLQMSQRHLDSNIVRVRPDARIESHAGPDLDVLILVLDGGGELVTETGGLPLTTGALAWLPRRCLRSFIAGQDGLTYLTVHTRRPMLTIGPAPAG